MYSKSKRASLTSVMTSAFAGLAMLLVIGNTHAAVVTTLGAGSAVTNPDRQATFDSLVNGQNLTNYQEDGLFVTAPGTQFQTTGSHYENAGNFSFVTIATVDGSDFFGLEFNVGSGFGNSDMLNIVWETFRDGSSTGSGFLTGILGGSSSNASAGSVVGWTDTLLFDTLHVGASNSISYQAFGAQQAISLDNVKIQNTVSAVPVPAAVWLFGTALIGFVGMSRRRKGA